MIVSRSFIRYLTDQLDTSNWRIPAHFLVGGMFFATWGIVFDFCYDLGLSSQGQAVREFFIGMGFFSYFVKSTRGVLIKCVRKLHRQVAHDLIIVDLQLTYFCIYWCAETSYSVI